MREKTIEQKLSDEVKKRGGLALKFTSSTFIGMPDRIILIPDGKIGFVEVKAPGEVPRPLQKSRIRMLKEMGFKVYVLDEERQIGGIIDDIQAP